MTTFLPLKRSVLTLDAVERRVCQGDGAGRRCQDGDDVRAPQAAWDSSSGKYTFTHKALGAEKFRYSWNFGQNWTTWTAYEDVTSMDTSLFDNSENWWTGEHIMVQCMCFF